MSTTISQGEIVKLKPKSRHGKNRLNEHGEHWVVMNVGAFKGQPALHLRSKGKTFKMGSSWVFDGRWVLLNNDSDFEIVQVDRSEFRM